MEEKNRDVLSQTKQEDEADRMLAPEDADMEAVSDLLENFPLADTIKRHTRNMMWSMVRLQELQMVYSCAIKEIRTKFEVLDTEFEARYKRNPIKSIAARVKSSESILEKLVRRGFPVTLRSVEENLNDVAGIRVVCSYIDDIYRIADAFLAQDDITLLQRKDYIAAPKPNGYRSLHLIVQVPVFFAEQRKEVKAEVQIRTIAMDFWASLEHQLSYKQEVAGQAELCAELRACADVITETDRKMLALRKKIEEAEDIPTEEEALLLRLQRLRHTGT